MNPESLFELVNASVVPFWLLMLLAPRWRWTQHLVHSVLVPALLGIAYVALLTTSPAPSPEAPQGFTLKAIMAALSVPQVFVAAWIHYLVFDLFVGAWMVRDAQRHRLHHLWVVPCALGAFLFGPAGLLAYVVVRGLQRQDFSLQERAGAVPSSSSN